MIDKNNYALLVKNKETKEILHIEVYSEKPISYEISTVFDNLSELDLSITDVSIEIIKLEDNMSFLNYLQKIESATTELEDNTFYEVDTDKDTVTVRKR